MKYKYFIPLIGMLLLTIDIFNYENSILEKHYGEDLGLLLIFSMLMYQAPSFVWLCFYLFII